MTAVTPPMRRNAIIVATVMTAGVAAIGGSLTDLGPWYLALREPAWKPPDMAFGPIWTVIFALTAAAAVIAWQNEPVAPRRWRLVVLFSANGLLNIFWSALFFTLHRPDLALWEVAALWLSVLVLILAAYRRSPLASALLVPYLIWVSIASRLTYEVVQLNAPFN